MHFAKRAFTLVELLIAISIIGVLATIVSQNYQTAKIKAMDASVKADVRSYRQAMELYYAKNKTYFVYDTSTVCAERSRINAGGYTREGTGAGCVGYYGSGEGQMTRRQPADGSRLTHYSKTMSIADVLVKEGVLTSVYTFPESKDFTARVVRYLAPPNATVQVPADFILTICDSEGHEAASKEVASNYAIFAQPIKPGSSDRPRSTKLCGAQPYGWNVLEALDQPIP